MLLFFKKYKIEFLLFGLFLLQFFFISPIGEFPLNDDWVHIDTIRHLVDTGIFRMLPFAGPTFYVPILYGSVLVKLFGFSYTLLRISTLCLAFLTLIIFYRLCLYYSEKKEISFALTLLLWINPLFYHLSFSFMTDIPALALLISAAAAYTAGFAREKTQYFFLGSLFAILGFYTRQTTILIFLAVGIALLYQKKFADWKTLCFGFVIPGILLLGSYFLLAQNHLLPQSLSTHMIEGDGRLFGHVRWWTWYIPMYLGLFTFPLTFAWVAKQKKTFWINPLSYIFPLVTVLIAAIIYKVFHLQLPYMTNIISTTGLGPMSGVLNGIAQPMWPHKVWVLLTGLSAISTGLLFSLFFQQKNNNKPQTFVWIFAILYIIPLLLFEGFDRYLLPLFAIFLLLLSSRLQSLSKFVWIPLVFIIAVYSISQTAFYLSWNNAKTQLADKALILTHGVVHDVDGGYEWDGAHSYWDAQASGIAGGPGTAPWWIRSLFTNNTEHYIVSWKPIPPYSVIETKHIAGWNKNNTLYLLKKPEVQ